jgi:hypothetical protein
VQQLDERKREKEKGVRECFNRIEVVFLVDAFARQFNSNSVILSYDSFPCLDPTWRPESDRNLN